MHRKAEGGAHRRCLAAQRLHWRLLLRPARHHTGPLGPGGAAAGHKRRLPEESAAGHVGCGVRACRARAGGSRDSRWSRWQCGRSKRAPDWLERRLEARHTPSPHLSCKGRSGVPRAFPGGNVHTDGAGKGDAPDEWGSQDAGPAGGGGLPAAAPPLFTVPGSLLRAWQPGRTRTTAELEQAPAVRALWPPNMGAHGAGSDADPDKVSVVSAAAPGTRVCRPPLPPPLHC